MTIEMDYEVDIYSESACDNCTQQLLRGDMCYCQACFIKLEDKIVVRNEAIHELEEEIKELKDKLEEMEQVSEVTGVD